MEGLSTQNQIILRNMKKVCKLMYQQLMRLCLYAFRKDLCLEDYEEMLRQDAKSIKQNSLRFHS